MAEAKAKKPFYEIVAENLIAQLKEGLLHGRNHGTPALLVSHCL